MPRRWVNNIRALREGREPPLSQAGLARLLGCDKADIGRYERGERLPSLPVAILLSLVLGVTLEELFFDIRDRAKAYAEALASGERNDKDPA